jgi:hypothetical protein
MAPRNPAPPKDARSRRPGNRHMQVAHSLLLHNVLEQRATYSLLSIKYNDRLNPLGVSPPAQVPIPVPVLSQENTCRSCLVIINQGVNVCPFCGADQTPLPGVIISEQEESRNLTSVFLRWIIVTVAVACSMAGLLWYARREHVKKLGEQAETTASKALHDIRIALSQHALTSGDQYPSALGTLGDPAAKPFQEARNESYEVIYTPKSSKEDGTITGFELWANPGKPNLRSFFIDESGVLRATQENRPANDKDPPI